MLRTVRGLFYADEVFNLGFFFQFIVSKQVFDSMQTNFLHTKPMKSQKKLTVKKLSCQNPSHSRNLWGQFNYTCQPQKLFRSLHGFASVQFGVTTHTFPHRIMQISKLGFGEKFAPPLCVARYTIEGQIHSTKISWKENLQTNFLNQFHCEPKARWRPCCWDKSLKNPPTHCEGEKYCACASKQQISRRFASMQTRLHVGELAPRGRVWITVGGWFWL